MKKTISVEIPTDMLNVDDVSQLRIEELEKNLKNALKRETKLKNEVVDLKADEANRHIVIAAAKDFFTAIEWELDLHRDDYC